MSRALLPVVVGVVALAFTSACDLFGVVKCGKDADCPGGVPFCVDGTCNKTNDPGRDGHGITGDGTCTTDAECAPSLCYDIDDTTGRNGTCVPAANEAPACPEAAQLGSSTDADPGSPVIFGASAILQSGSCSVGQLAVSVDLAYFDREGDVLASDTGAFVFSPTSISPLVGGGSIEGDGTSGHGFFFFSECVDQTTDHIAVKIGPFSARTPTSNALCVPITGAP